MCTQTEDILSKYVQLLTELDHETAKDAHNAIRILNKNTYVKADPELFAMFPTSPTAQKYLTAYDTFTRGLTILKKYSKDDIESILDCEFLKQAFHSYAEAYLTESHLFDTFKPPVNTSKLVDRYLKIKPGDLLVQYFKVILTIRKHFKPDESRSELSDYEQNKIKIVAAEKFAHRLLAQKDNIEMLNAKRILIDLYFFLGSMYSITGQSTRALHSFETCYELDKTNNAALYGIAYENIKQNRERAIELFKEFVEIAPVCDKKFPCAYYMLATLTMTGREPNYTEVLKYICLAEDAEKKRLPFLYPLNIPEKQYLQVLKQFL